MKFTPHFCKTTRHTGCKKKKIIKHISNDFKSAGCVSTTSHQQLACAFPCVLTVTAPAGISLHQQFLCSGFLFFFFRLFPAQLTPLTSLTSFPSTLLPSSSTKESLSLPPHAKDVGQFTVRKKSPNRGVL